MFELYACVNLNSMGNLFGATFRKSYHPNNLEPFLASDNRKKEYLLTWLTFVVIKFFVMLICYRFRDFVGKAVDIFSAADNYH